MKEIRSILQKANEWSGQKMLLATVIKVEGSSYRRQGARMLICETGLWEGGISGGCLEGDALKKARVALAKNTDEVVVYDTGSDDPMQIGVSLGCKGIIHVWLSPFTESSFAILQKASESREPFTHQWQIPNNQVFEEHFKPNIRLHLVGTNYDIYPVIDVAHTLGYDVSVSSNPVKFRPAYKDKVRAVLDKEDIPQLDQHTALVLMSHDYYLDLALMLKLYQNQAKMGYLGMLGPAKRNIRMYEDLAKEGIEIDAAFKNQIHNPVGLAIGAINPEEIAVSIMAEIIQFFSPKK